LCREEHLHFSFTELPTNTLRAKALIFLSFSLPFSLPLSCEREKENHTQKSTERGF
jgi:hypothetical protein